MHGRAVLANQIAEKIGVGLAHDNGDQRR